jgi:DNA modification methylase
VTVRILIGDVRDKLRELPEASIDCVVTSPPYWGLRDYGVEGQIGLERTLGEHLDVMVDVFNEVRRVMKPEATLWLNCGDCYATKPNGRSAADTKAAGNDDRTFRDKPFDTTGAIYRPNYEKRPRCGDTENFGNLGAQHGGRVVGVGPVLKPKDLCLVPNRLAIALQEAGWWVRSEIIWAKPNPMPDSSGRYRPSTAHEKIFMLAKSGRCFYDAAAVSRPVSGGTHARMAQDVEAQLGSDRANAGGKTNGRMKAVRNGALNGDNGLRASMSVAGSFVETRYLRNYEPAPMQVWEIGTRSFRDAHFATFPPELAERCILAGCPTGGTVLDPFGGAGTTGLVADRLQRSAVLIELNPDYAEMAHKRIESDAGQLFPAVEVANG